MDRPFSVFCFSADSSLGGTPLPRDSSNPGPCVGCFSDVTENNLGEFGHSVQEFLRDELDNAVKITDALDGKNADNGISKGEDCSVRIKSVDKFQKQVYLILCLSESIYV